MKVKVRIIKPPYPDVPTESLQAILRNHAHDKLLIRIGTNWLFDIMEVLVERNEAAGRIKKTAEEALAEFYQQYMPRKTIRQLRADYLGGYDHGLVELSDVLPASLYAPQALNKKK